MVQSLIGPRIREKRRALKLTQAALAHDVGISPSYLNLIEHNRRGIAGRTLHAIARRLGADPRAFSDGADANLIEALTAAAATAETPAEVDRVGELIGRFPGWAGLLADLHNRTEAQAESLSMLSDRINHDPYLADAMHLILSNITAIQSTAGILATAEGLADDRRQKFTKNIHSESERLTTTAKDLVAYLDNPSEQPRHSDDAAAPVHALWSRIGHDAPELEQAIADGTAPESAAAHVLSTARLAQADQTEARRTLLRHAKLAGALPLDAFATSAASLAYDPLALMRETGRSFADILVRLSHLPETDKTPGFGLIECDASGGVLMRKDHRAMTLPKTGGACPLWPVYRAAALPGQPVRALLETPSDGVLTAYAIATPDDTPTPFGTPPVLRSLMIFTDHSAAMPAHRAAAPVLHVGPHCSVCPRKACASRRMPYILG